MRSDRLSRGKTGAASSARLQVVTGRYHERVPARIAASIALNRSIAGRHSALSATSRLAEGSATASNSSSSPLP
jgi:hypothetical protein